MCSYRDDIALQNDHNLRLKQCSCDHEQVNNEDCGDLRAEYADDIFHSIDRCNNADGDTQDNSYVLLKGHVDVSQQMQKQHQFETVLVANGHNVDDGTDLNDDILA